MANGSFEVDEVGDGKPEYWMTYDYSGKLRFTKSYPRMHRDTRMSHSGAASLRIAPVAAEIKGAKVAVFLLATMLFPKTKYRLSAWIRIPEGGKAAIIGWRWQPLKPVSKPTAEGWQKFEMVFTTSADATGMKNPILLSNPGATPVWFDDVTASIVGR